MMGFGFMGLLGILAIVAVVVLLAALARGGARSAPGSASGPTSDTPEEILRRRYAKGEIDHDEYEQRLADLRR